jgi:protein ImuB
MSRIACGYIARFELAVRARQEPELWERAVAIADLSMKGSRLQAVTAVAEQHGVYVGQSLTQALAIHSSLEILAPDPEQLQRAEQELHEALGKLSYAIDSDGFGAFFVNADKLEQIHENENVLARRLRTAFRALGYDTRLGIADGSLAAWVAARRSAGITCVPPGEDAVVLADVSIQELGLPPPVLERFDLLGIRTVGQLAVLPPGSLSLRWPEGARLERFCRGEVRIAWPTPERIPEQAESVALDLDTPTEDLEPILFLFKSLLDQLLLRVSRTRRALAELLILVRLDDRSEAEHRLVPASPTLDARTLMDLLRLWLSGQPFQSAVASIRLVASRLETATPQQLDLLNRKQERADDALQRAAVRLTAAFGASAVVRPVLADTWRPESRLRWVPFASREEKRSAPTHTSTTRPAPVVLHLVSPPQAVQWNQRRLQRPDGTTMRIVQADGPHRISGDWWDNPFDRSYFWLTGSSGERIWVFRDELDPRTEKGTYLQAVAD